MSRRRTALAGCVDSSTTDGKQFEKGAHGLVAYVAGCIVCVQDVARSTTFYLRAPDAKPVSCVSFSPCGKLLAVGEKGHRPRIVLWDMETRAPIAELQGHQFGVSCVAWSPSASLLASAGFQHDGCVLLYDVSTKKVSSSEAMVTKLTAEQDDCELQSGRQIVCPGF